jgi:hypothetical protein
MHHFNYQYIQNKKLLPKYISLKNKFLSETISIDSRPKLVMLNKVKVYCLGICQGLFVNLLPKIIFRYTRDPLGVLPNNWLS